MHQLMHGFIFCPDAQLCQEPITDLLVGIKALGFLQPFLQCYLCPTRNDTGTTRTGFYSPTTVLTHLQGLWLNHFCRVTRFLPKIGSCPIEVWDRKRYHSKSMDDRLTVLAHAASVPRARVSPNPIEVADHQTKGKLCLVPQLPKLAKVAGGRIPPAISHVLPSMRSALESCRTIPLGKLQPLH